MLLPVTPPAMLLAPGNADVQPTPPTELHATCASPTSGAPPVNGTEAGRGVGAATDAERGSARGVVASNMLKSGGFSDVVPVRGVSSVDGACILDAGAGLRTEEKGLASVRALAGVGWLRDGPKKLPGLAKLSPVPVPVKGTCPAGEADIIGDRTDAAVGKSSEAVAGGIRERASSGRLRGDDTLAGAAGVLGKSELCAPKVAMRVSEEPTALVKAPRREGADGGRATPSRRGGRLW